MTDPVSISHEGYLEILVTALGVLATLFAILIAVLGFVGYASLKQSAAEAAEKAAERRTEKIVEERFAILIEQNVKTSINAALERNDLILRSNEQAANLSQDQATGRDNKTNHGMDNVWIRPKKRVFNDTGIGEDEP